MYRVKLEQFEGPLDLLLFFVRKDELNIYDIPIAYITKQYLEYLHLMRTLNLDIAGEFILMAATLMRIKAKMMLPPDPTNEEEEELIDPRQELSRRLVEYRQFKEASKSLAELDEYWRSVYRRSYFNFDLIPQQTEEAVGLKDISFFDLLTAYKNAMAKKPAVIYHNVERLNVTVEEQQEYIMDFFRDRNMYTFLELVEDMSKIEVVVTFLALLDLIKKGEIAARQATLFDDIWIYKASAYIDEIPEELRSDEALNEQAQTMQEETVISEPVVSEFTEVQTTDDAALTIDESVETVNITEIEQNSGPSELASQSAIATEVIEPEIETVAESDRDTVNEAADAEDETNVLNSTVETDQTVAEAEPDEVVINETENIGVVVSQSSEHIPAEYSDNSNELTGTTEEISPETHQNDLPSDFSHDSQATVTTSNEITVTVRETTEADFYTQLPSEDVTTESDSAIVIEDTNVENIASNEQVVSLLQDNAPVDVIEKDFDTPTTDSIVSISDENSEPHLIEVDSSTEESASSTYVSEDAIRSVIAESQAKIHIPESTSPETNSDNVEEQVTDEEVSEHIHKAISGTEEVALNNIDVSDTSFDQDIIRETNNVAEPIHNSSEAIQFENTMDSELTQDNANSTPNTTEPADKTLNSDEVLEENNSSNTPIVNETTNLAENHQEKYETIKPDLIKPNEPQETREINAEARISKEKKENVFAPLTEKTEAANETLINKSTTNEQSISDESEKPSIITVFVRKIVSFVKRFFGK